MAFICHALLGSYGLYPSKEGYSNGRLQYTSGPKHNKILPADGFLTSGENN